MLTLIKILVVTAAVLALAGFITVTFGLFKSFILDKFSKFIYLGLAVICSGVLVFGLAGGVTFIHLRAMANDIVSSINSDQEATADDEVYEDAVPLEEEFADTESEGHWVDDGMHPEELIAQANNESSVSYPTCVPSPVAEGDVAFYIMQDPQYLLRGETYLVPISDTEAYISFGIHEEENAVVYVNSITYETASANEVAESYTYHSSVQDMGVVLPDTAPEAYEVAEGCGL